MARQSITLTEPNDRWLKSQIDNQEFASKSEIVNDLIRKARTEEDHLVKLVRDKLIKAEQGGFTSMGKEEILKLSKEQIRKDGQL
jgi:antitoxin ParD1/3/4